MADFSSMTPEEIRDSGNVDPVFKAYWDEHKIPNMIGNVEGLRAYIKKSGILSNEEEKHEEANVDEYDVFVKVRDGQDVPVLVYKPSSPPPGGSPLVVMMHGGGYIFGDRFMEEIMCRGFVKNYGCVCLSIDYRLAPEHPWPTAVYDCWDVVQWAAKNYSQFQADPQKGFIIGGTSAGGGLSGVVTHLARDEGLSPPLTGALLMIPGLLPKGRLDLIPEKYRNLYYSWDGIDDALILPQAMSKWFSELYKPDPTSHLCAPILNPKGLANLPPTYFQVCGLDHIRDDGVIYEKALREDYNVPTKARLYTGVPHGFYSYAPMLEKSKQFYKDTIEEGMPWLLSFSKDLGN